MPEIKIFDALPEEEILAQMAEECVEASKAALKLRRVRCGVNPTPVSEKDAFENLVEELADISDLKIYDQPKSLSGFSRHDFRGMNGTDVCGNESCEHYQPSGSYMLPPTCAINGCCLSKPPQSWCYVAEAKEDDAL